MNEIKNRVPDAEFILVGTKHDLRELKDSKNIITFGSGVIMKKKIKASAFMECSSNSRKNIKEVIECAVECVLTKTKPKSRKKCSLM